MIYTTIIKSVKYCGIVYGIYMIWILLHFAATHLYVSFCVPFTFTGLVLSPIIMTNSYCVALRWIIYNAGHQIRNMWITVSTYITNKLISVF